MTQHLEAILPLEGLQAGGSGPLYLKLRQSLEEAILSGKLNHGDALPPERDLADYASISRVTVRKAVDDLVKDGLLVRRHGSGTFVVKPVSRVQQSLSRLTSFTEDMARRGLTTTAQWIERGLFHPSPDEMMVLGLAADSLVARLGRLRIADDMPLAIERASISAEFLPDPIRIGTSLYAELDKTKSRPVRAVQRISACSLKDPDAAMLGVPVGSASLSIERISYLASGRVVEFTRSLYRGDAYDFVAELTLPESKNGPKKKDMTMQTNMRREIDEIPEAAARLLGQSGTAIKQAGAALREKDPAFFVTIARGSSDHAALFLKYAIELSTGRPVASLGPSLASIYGARMHLQGAASIAISQSGKSPDIVAMAEAATKAGAVTIALTNTLPSPISQASTHPLDILAGPEIAVAATKSYVNSIVAGLAILGEWTGDEALQRAVADLPTQFAKAVKLDWQALADELGDAESLFVLGRGPALAIASEAALKFKETSGMHAEAYSAAEVLHGPVALVEKRFPVIGLAARDAAEGSVTGVLDGLSSRGALAFVTSSYATSARVLPFVATGHPITDALTLILPFYGFVESWSRSRGLNPDAPVALKKVTETR